MKFIILFYEFQNNWIKVQTTPYIHSGEIFTDEGYVYNVWSPPSGIYSEEYNLRIATEEVNELIGNSGGFEELLQGESIMGYAVFEIPKDAEPIDAKLIYVPNLIVFQIP